VTAGSAVRNRPETLTLPSPTGEVEIVRQQWRSHKVNSRWEWVWIARRRGQTQWRQGRTAREAIRQATLLAAGKQPAWLAEAAARAERELSRPRGLEDLEGEERRDGP
jgi:hypothetical protein